jgi:enamine deaminase RidA (YjgF/YER057c/UK114 family)
MKKTLIDENGIANPHPYFPVAAKAGPFMFISGQMGLDRTTGLPLRLYSELPGKRPFPALGMMAPDSWEETFIAQSARMYENLDILLKGQGAGKDSLLFYSIYMRAMRNFPVIVRARSALFQGEFAPPSTASQLPELALPEAVVYFDPIAFVPHGDTKLDARVVLKSKHLDQGPLSNYQLGTRVGPYLFFAGIVAAQPETGFVVRNGHDLDRAGWQRPSGKLAARLIQEPISAQTYLIYEFFEKLLVEQGARIEDLLKIFIYVRRMPDLPAIEAVSQAFLKGSLPAASAIGVQSLAMGDFLIEIEGMALAPGMGAERRSVREVPGVAAWGHHAVATRGGDLVFVSALLGYDVRRERMVLHPNELDAEDRSVAEDALREHAPQSTSEVVAAAQAVSVFGQLERALKATGSSLAETLKISVHLREMRDFTVVGAVARRIFGDNPPALAVMAVDDLPLPQARLQVEAFAAAS